MQAQKAKTAKSKVLKLLLWQQTKTYCCYQPQRQNLQMLWKFHFLRRFHRLIHFRGGLKSPVHFRHKNQGWTLALARSPRRVSKLSGERKSRITRSFGECDFSSPGNK